MKGGQRRSADADRAFLIYTDGGCRGNPGVGAWAAVIRSGSDRNELCGVEERTTNNRMELSAALEALRSLPEGSSATLYTDSTYLRNGMTQWVANWIRRGWRTSSKKPVLNQDLWKALVATADRLDVSWQWVRGHAGDPENERCDELVNYAMDALERGESPEAIRAAANPGASPEAGVRVEGPGRDASGDEPSVTGRNVEIKARVADRDTLARRIAALSGSRPRVLRQRDVFFPSVEGRLKLRSVDGKDGELIAYSRADEASACESSYSIARSEKPADLERVLSAALGRRGLVVKTRELSLVGQTRIHLDAVDGLGDFLELEVVLRPGQSAEDGRAIAEDLMLELGVSPADLIDRAYVDLLEA